MNLVSLMNRLCDGLSHGPVDIGEFVASFYPHDIEAGQLLMGAFDARLLRGRLCAKTWEFEGHISGIADDTRPVWH